MNSHPNSGTPSSSSGTPHLQQQPIQPEQPPDFKMQYRQLKQQFKKLVYENECYQEELRSLQRKLLKLARDKNFLLDRLLQYEPVSSSDEDSDATLMSEDEQKPPIPPLKLKLPRRRASAPRKRQGSSMSTSAPGMMTPKSAASGESGSYDLQVKVEKLSDEVLERFASSSSSSSAKKAKVASTPQIQSVDGGNNSDIKAEVDDEEDTKNDGNKSGSSS